MLERIKRLLWPGGYTEAERAIFHYWDGKKSRRADPLAVRRKLNDGSCDWVSLCQTLSVAANMPKAANDTLRYNAIRGRENAIERLSDHARHALALPPFEDGGLPDAAVLEVFAGFLRFMNEVREDVLPLVEPPKPTDSGFLADAPPTEPSPDSPSSPSLTDTSEWPVPYGRESQTSSPGSTRPSDADKVYP